MDMVERVARAIWEAECSPIIDDDVQGWQQMVARVAIEAMREPTEAMKYAPEWTTFLDADECWKAMIDEALANRGEV